MDHPDTDRPFLVRGLADLGTEFRDCSIYLFVLLRGDTVKHRLKRLWAGWKKTAHAIANFQARILLTVIYAVLVLPFGLMVRWFSDSLHTKKRPTGWLEHSPVARNLEQARRQG